MNDMMIVAVDPGKMTGVAVLDTSDVYTGWEGELHDALRSIDVQLDLGHKFVIVCEDFIYTQATAKKSRQTWSTEGIGVLRYLAETHGVQFVLQTPAAAKRFATDEKLKVLDWHHPTKGGHRNDAARHLLLYADSVGRIDRRRLLHAVD